MLAEEELRRGNVAGALAQLKAAVQQNPAEAKYRAFLFQLLSIVGKWDSALNQLEVAGDLDPGMLAMVQAYREALRCEQQRGEVFDGRRSPVILGEPDRWLALLIQSLKHTAVGQHAQASRLREEALEAAPATAGTIEVTGDHQSTFEWLADADLRLGPVLEVFLNGQYYWIPLHRIAQIDLEAPADLRDFVWTPAHFTWANGGQAVGMIPTRYPGSEASEDPLIQLARKTDWIDGPGADAESPSDQGIGQRMLATDQDEFALLDIRKIVLEVESQAADQSLISEEND